MIHLVQLASKVNGCLSIFAGNQGKNTDREKYILQCIVRFSKRSCTVTKFLFKGTQKNMVS